MSNKKTVAAEQLIINYLRNIYLKEVRGESLSYHEQYCIQKKEALITEIFEYGKNEIIPYEKGAKKKPGDTKLEISDSTVSKAIDKLLSESRILRKNGCYKYNPTEGDIYVDHPILKIARHIQVTPLDASNIFFFHVSSKFAPSVSSYLNSIFSMGDIYSIPIGDVILCMDIAIPASSNRIEKKQDVSTRVLKALRDFDIYFLNDFDDKHGLTLDELMEKHFKEFRKAQNSAPCYGGKVKGRTVRARITKKK